MRRLICAFVVHIWHKEVFYDEAHLRTTKVLNFVQADSEDYDQTGQMQRLI